MFNKKFETELNVEGMHCGHCAKRVEDGLKKIKGVSKVVVDLNQHKVCVISKTEIDKNTIALAIEDLGYSVK